MLLPLRSGQRPSYALRVTLSLTVHENGFPVHSRLWAGTLQGGTRLCRACTQPRNALAGRANLRDDQPQELLRLAKWARVWHPLDLLKGYHPAARGRARRRTDRFRRGLPPGCRVVGLRQIDGMPHQFSARKIDSSGRRRAVGRREVSRNLEK